MSCYQIIEADSTHDFTLIVIRHGEGLHSGLVMEEITDADYPEVKTEEAA